MTTTRAPRCSRGRLLARHRDACWRARLFLGTHGLAGGGTLLLEESRGAILRELAGKWRVEQYIPRVGRIVGILKDVERQELFG